ncbi:MAG TPA: hypothetical protein VGJ20_02575 [Xanthobacteraceae bacterium]|jgi:hypothetical protein
MNQFNPNKPETLLGGREEAIARARQMGDDKIASAVGLVILGMAAVAAAIYYGPSLLHPPVSMACSGTKTAFGPTVITSSVTEEVTVNAVKNVIAFDRVTAPGMRTGDTIYANGSDGQVRLSVSVNRVTGALDAFEASVGNNARVAAWHLSCKPGKHLF